MAFIKSYILFAISPKNFPRINYISALVIKLSILITHSWIK